MDRLLARGLLARRHQDLHRLGDLAAHDVDAAELAHARARLVHLVVARAGLAAHDLAVLGDLHALRDGLAGLALGHGIWVFRAEGYFVMWLGWRSMIMRLPSWRGSRSTLATSESPSRMRAMTLTPSSLNPISRPRKTMFTWSLSPCWRKPRACFILVSRSCTSILGRTRISFTTTLCCFFRASCSFLLIWYLYLP